MNYIKNRNATTNEMNPRLGISRNALCSTIQRAVCADSRRRTLKRRTSTVKSETASLPSYTPHDFPSPLSPSPHFICLCFSSVSTQTRPPSNLSIKVFFSPFYLLYPPSCPSWPQPPRGHPSSRPNRPHPLRVSGQLLPCDSLSFPSCSRRAIASICTIVATAGETAHGNFGRLCDDHDSLAFSLVPCHSPLFIPPLHFLPSLRSSSILWLTSSPAGLY